MKVKCVKLFFIFFIIWCVEWTFLNAGKAAQINYSVLNRGGGIIEDLVADNETAFIGTDYGIYAVDISNITTPALKLKTSLTDYSVESLFLQGDYLFAVSQNPADKLSILNKNLEKLGEIEIADKDIQGVYLKNNYLFISTQQSFTNSTLEVYDISSLNNPQHIKTLDLKNSYCGKDIVELNNKLYLLTGEDLNYINEINIADPTNPEILQSVLLQEATYVNQTATALLRHDGILLTINNGIPVKIPPRDLNGNVLYGGAYFSPVVYPYKNGHVLFLKGNELSEFSLNATGGFAGYFSATENFKALWNDYNSGSLSSNFVGIYKTVVYYNGNKLLILSGKGLLLVCDTSLDYNADTNSYTFTIKAEASYGIPTSINSVYADENYYYFSCWGGLDLPILIFDKNMKYLGYTWGAGKISYAKNGTLYVKSDSYFLKLNVLNATTPEEIKKISFPLYFDEPIIQTDEKYIYSYSWNYVDGKWYLEVANISDFDNVTSIHKTPADLGITDNISKVTFDPVKKVYFLLDKDNSTIIAYDFSDPSNITKLGELYNETFTNFTDLSMVAYYPWLIIHENDEKSFLIINVSNFTSMKMVKRIFDKDLISYIRGDIVKIIPSERRGIFYVIGKWRLESTAYNATGSFLDTNNIFVFNFSNPDSPVLEGWFFTKNFPQVGYFQSNIYNSNLILGDNYYEIDKISINQPPVIISFTADPASGEAPLEVHFTCSAQDQDGSISAYKWDFDGDGNIDKTTTTGETSHTYQNPGTYNATCMAVDENGATASEKVEISVTSASSESSTNETTSTSSETSSGGGCNISPYAPFSLDLSFLFGILLFPFRYVIRNRKK